MNRLKFIGGRLGAALLVLLVITAACFAIFYLMPANPAQLSCGKPCTPEKLAEVESFLGVDQAWYVQMWEFLKGIVLGREFGEGAAALHCTAPCFGYSFRLREDVTTLILERLPLTLSLAIGAVVIWTVLGVGAGVLAALRRGRPVDRLLTGASVVGVSAPVYLTALLGILLFGFTLNVLPIGGYVPFTESPGGWLFHLILPWTVLAVANGAIYTRLSRGQLLDVMGQDFIRTGRAIGLPESKVVGKHGLRSLVVPISTLIALDLGTLIGSTVITERVFSMQGLGALLMESVSFLDLQVIVGVTLFAATAVILANVVVDVLYAVLDPRIGEVA